MVVPGKYSVTLHKRVGGVMTQLAGPMSNNWLPNTTQGRMVGDYISTSYANGVAHGLFAVATLPTGTFSRDCATASPN